MKTLAKMIWIAASLMMVACGNDNNEEPDPVPTPAIYSQSPLSISENGIDDTFTLNGASASETAINIIGIATDKTAVSKAQEDIWYDFNALDATTFYKAAGYASYPNTVDFLFEHKWIKVATEKHAGNREGKLRIVAEPNPYNKARACVVYLKNEQAQILEVVQNSNPVGTTPADDGDAYYDLTANN
jgi:hypothetical protein